MKRLYDRFENGEQEIISQYHHLTSASDVSESEASDVEEVQFTKSKNEQQ